ncbi:LysR family transcriptional regulator [Aliidongia dinghuensis]|uniref:LysR family transcriptional regulator n=1 Tax=Aliidongia dinghuensis TaxID=1867774 RepID=A0A8J2YZ50_9PROT|nr:LysR substrate-binding domain-containing protein [Aliidongia dinghuensis]GGF39143.1 LysR family transcriptional regulator [Aliidongia dinghuensis]
MKRRSPPWGAIEAFITAARTNSFKEAADQLGLSPPAFSRRIQALENHIGVKLFDRAAPLPVLTVSGARYLERLQPGYDAMRAATDWMMPDADRRPIRIGVSQSLAVSWLVPRLPRFYARADGIQLVLQSTNHGADLLGGGADVTILYGTGDWDHLVSQKLFGLEAFVVSAPRLADGRPVPRSVADLAGHRLFELVHPANQWADWLALAGYRSPIEAERAAFDGAQVMYEAAARGLGVALGVRPLVDPFLADGRLEIAFDLSLPLAGSYYVVAQPEVRRQRAVQTLWRWLVAEAAAPTAVAA